MKTALHHFTSRRVDAWQSEWEFLQRSLAREPDAPQAWWWKIRLRVLAFVIVRYGADPAVRARDHLPAPRGSDDLTFVERRTVEPRPRAALGAHLQSIAAANDGPRAPLSRDDDDWAARTRRLEMRFVIGAVLGAITGATIAFAGGSGDSTEICKFAIGFWIAGGMLSAIFTGPLAGFIARRLTKD